MNNPGFVDGWIDFNADGDWNDPGEQILDSVRFLTAGQTLSFQVTVPATSPIPAVRTSTFARFRSSSTGGLVPTGLAVDGEVEDYLVTIVPGNQPTAVNDTYLFNEDSTFTTVDANGTATPGFLIDDGVAANDIDPQGGPFGVELLTPPAHSAAFTLSSNGTFSYRPTADFNGVDTFTYRVNDGVLKSTNIGTVTLTVSEVNDLPFGTVDPITVNEDAVLNVPEATLLAKVSPGPANESNQTLRITGVDPISARGGSVSLIAGRVIYTAPSNYNGPDSFTILATDNGTTNGLPAPQSTPFQVNINILDKNDVPITVPKFGNTDEDTTVAFSVSTLISGDLPGPPSEVATQTISFRDILPLSTNGGTVTLSLDRTTVTYTPRTDFNGQDTFFYEIIDNGFSGGQSDPQIGRGTVTVTVRPVNDAPRVSNPLGTITMLEDEATRVIDLNTVFFDPDVASNSDSLTYSVVSNDNTSVVTPSIVGGQLNLQLQPDQNGRAIIVLRATDTSTNTVTSTFTLTVTPVNDAPRLVRALDDISTPEDVNPVNITLRPRFFDDPDIGNGDVLSFTVVSNSNSLLVTPTISGGVLSLQLGSNRSGSAVLVVQATDSTGQTVSDTFTLLVTPVDDVPVTIGDSYTVPRGTTFRATDARGSNTNAGDNGVLANDSDPEGATLTASVVTGPAHGTVSLNSDGTFTYIHNGSQLGTDTFTYRASDATGNRSVVTTVTFTIGAAPPPLHQNPQVIADEEGATGHRDVNADGFITPIDALLVINFLNTNGSQSVVGLPAPPPYRDTSGDNFISALDALLVINYLNNRGRAGGGEGELQGEGEQGMALLMAPIDAGRGTEGTAIGTRMLELGDGEFYGPTQASDLATDAAEAFFAEGETDGWFPADTSWLDDQYDSLEEQAVPIDLVFASLMPDLDENDLA